MDTWIEFDWCWLVSLWLIAFSKEEKVKVRERRREVSVTLKALRRSSRSESSTRAWPPTLTYSGFCHWYFARDARRERERELGHLGSFFLSSLFSWLLSFSHPSCQMRFWVYNVGPDPTARSRGRQRKGARGGKGTSTSGIWLWTLKLPVPLTPHVQHRHFMSHKPPSNHCRAARERVLHFVICSFNSSQVHSVNGTQEEEPREEENEEEEEEASKK